MIRRVCGSNLLLHSAVLLTLTACLTVMAAASEPTTAWLQVTVQNSPSGRAAGAVAYDPVSKKIVLFGGFDNTTHLGDTWTFDGTDWVQVRAGVAPSPRSNAGMAFDRVTNKLVLFGGYDGSNYLNDTWLWDGSTETWTAASPTTSPQPATGPSLFTDPVYGHVDTFGGYNRTNGYSSTTWRWTGTTWNKVPVSNSPWARSDAEAITDPVHKTVILFGGLSDINPNNTFSFDGKTWTERTPASSPVALMFGGTAFDPVLGQAVIFGGWGGQNASDLEGTWAWDGSNWNLLNPMRRPSPREFPMMAYHEAAHRLFVFGGLQIVPNNLLNDTWKLVVKP